MSNRAARRTKSPAIRNKFNDIGITGRKTGVRVAGNVRVDDDGLENVDEFYQKTSPSQGRGDSQARSKPAAQTLHKLLSPTPIRSTPNYGTLMGALDIPAEPTGVTIDETATGEIEDEAILTPVQVRAARAARAAQLQMDAEDIEIDTPTKPMPHAAVKAANRRATLAPSGQQPSTEPDWVRSPKKGRRVTMAITAQKPHNGYSSVSAALYADDSEAVPAAADTNAYTAEEPAFSPDSHVDDEASAEADDGFVPVTDSVDDAFEDEAASLTEEAEEEGGELARDDDTADKQVSEAESLGDLRIGEDDTIPDSQDEEEEEEEEEEAPKSAKAPPAKPTSKKAKVTAAASDDEQPVRRSSRASVQPLAYWRNEHIEYEYESGPSKGVAVPKMKNIVRVRQTAEEKNNAKKRRVKRGTSVLPSLRGIKASEIDLDDRGRFYYYDDENYGFPVSSDATGKFGPKPSSKSKGANKRELERFDDDDDIPVDERPKVVLDVDGKTEVSQEVAISRQSIQWSEVNAKGNKYLIGSGLFVEESKDVIFANSGVLCLTVGGKKPARNSGDRHAIYLVTSGQVEVELHGSKFKVGVLGQFLIPAFNSYAITNVGTHPAQLYFVNVSMPIVEAAGDAEESSSDSG